MLSFGLATSLQIIKQVLVKNPLLVKLIESYDPIHSVLGMTSVKLWNGGEK